MRSCPVCEHVAHERIDRALAANQSPRQIARVFTALSKRQISEHKERCLLGSPLLVHAMRAGEITHEQLAGLLQNAGKSEEEAAEIVAAVREHLDREAVS
jgi:hypothetical protein